MRLLLLLRACVFSCGGGGGGGGEHGDRIIIGIIPYSYLVFNIINLPFRLTKRTFDC